MACRKGLSLRSRGRCLRRILRPQVMADALIVGASTERDEGRRPRFGTCVLLRGAGWARLGDAGSALPNAAEAPAPLAAAEGGLANTALDDPQVIIVDICVSRAGHWGRCLFLVVFGLLAFKEPSKDSRTSVVSVIEAQTMMIMTVMRCKRCLIAASAAEVKERNGTAISDTWVVVTSSSIFVMILGRLVLDESPGNSGVTITSIIKARTMLNMTMRRSRLTVLRHNPNTNIVANQIRIIITMRREMSKTV